MARSPKSDPSSPKGNSPSSKVRDGRVDKSKSKKAETKSPNYCINGRTYACQSCKKGHRVSKCTHASDRPVHMTNDPGRPAADSKRHCDCPKQCSCTKKNCKCARDCVCTQQMYIIVHVPFDRRHHPDSEQWEIKEQITTDLNGRRLTDAEIEERERLKAMQKRELDGAKAENSADGSPSLLHSIPAAETSIFTETASIKSCCAQKRAVEQQPSSLQQKKEVKQQTRDINQPKCNCGSGCACAFCLDHPNNSTSQRLLREQAPHLSHSSTGGLGTLQDCVGDQSFQNVSCMGTNPRFLMHSGPNPSPAALQGLFGGSSQVQPGYYISYPVTAYQPYCSTPLEDVELPTDFLSEMNEHFNHQPLSHLGVPGPYQPNPTSYVNFDSSAHQLATPFNSQLSTISMPMGSAQMQIGNASVSMPGMGMHGGFNNWQDPNMMWTAPPQMSHVAPSPYISDLLPATQTSIQYHPVSTQELPSVPAQSLPIHNNQTFNTQLELSISLSPGRNPVQNAHAPAPRRTSDLGSAPPHYQPAAELQHFAESMLGL